MRIPRNGQGPGEVRLPPGGEGAMESLCDLRDGKRAISDHAEGEGTAVFEMEEVCEFIVDPAGGVVEIGVDDEDVDPRREGGPEER